MNKTAIEWCDCTWNPVTGCKHGCPYCYARKIAERFKGSKAWPKGFEPMLHHERLFDPELASEKTRAIFVCSMADLFGKWVSDLWINFVMKSCDIGPPHTYIFLTKNPARYLMMPGVYFKENRWFGTTVTNAYDYGQRVHWLQQLPSENTFISFEPLLGNPGNIDLSGIKQVIIGAQTNPDVPLEYDDVLTICKAADRAGAKVFMKDSMAKWFPDRELRRELAWPVWKGVQHERSRLY